MMIRMIKYILYKLNTVMYALVLCLYLASIPNTCVYYTLSFPHKAIKNQNCSKNQKRIKITWKLDTLIKINTVISYHIVLGRSGEMIKADGTLID